MSLDRGFLIVGYKTFKENTKTTQIAFILYEEKLPKNWRDIVDNCPYGIFVSQVHTPDEKDKKLHRHGVIKDMHGHFLDYVSVMDILSSLNPSPAPALILVGGLQALKAYARYCVHFDRFDKEQFDINDPLTSDFELPSDGIVNGKLNIFDDVKGFHQGGGLDYVRSFSLTYREKEELKKSVREDERAELCSYIWENNVNDFASLAEYAYKCGYSSIWSDSGFYYRVCKSLQDRQTMQNKGQTIVQAPECMIDRSEILRNKAMVLAYISTFCSTLDMDIAQFIVDMVEDELDKGGISQLQFRRVFQKYIDPFTLQVRRYYERDFTDFKLWRGDTA